MRVIINGIEKFPSCCGECFLMDGETCECSVPGIERTCNPFDGRYDDCPMFPLRKAHGRIGDLGKVEDNMKDYYAKLKRNFMNLDETINQAIRTGYCAAANYVFEAETIVPAEEGER